MTTPIPTPSDRSRTPTARRGGASPAPARPRKGLFVPRLESLEAREVPALTLLDPLTQPKFVNPLPNPLDPAFRFAPVATNVDADGDGKLGELYRIGTYQTTQQLGIVNPATGAKYTTTVWGYGTSQQAASFPGRTIVAQRDRQVSVEWTNNLTDASGNPLQHLLPVDSTLHWADPLKKGHVSGPYTGPVPIVTHLHGGHTRSDSDGLPDAWFTPDGRDADARPDHTGRLYNRVYTYDNDQPAGTLWYHDHALGITRLNVYAGLAGFYLLRDAVDTGLPGNPAGLPAGKYEIPLAIQDRMFYGPGTTDDKKTPWVEAPGQLYYPSDPALAGGMMGGMPGMSLPNPTALPEFFGDHMLVNGQAWPVLDVEPREYRFRVLNGSDSRFYNLSLSNGGPIYQVGSDTALLDKAVKLSQVTLGAGERADVVIDFSKYAGQTLVLRNNANSPFPNGAPVDPRTTGQVMAFRVTRPLDRAVPLTDVTKAAVGSPIPRMDPATATVTRSLALFEGTDGYGRLQPQLGLARPARDASGATVNGSLLWTDPTTEVIRLGDTEVWEIYNATVDAHPVHLHLVSFQVVNRQNFTATVAPKAGMDMGSTGGVLTNIQLGMKPRGPAAQEAGWEDTVIVNPGEVVRIIARFDRAGEYVWHCHILSHEDNEMMRPFTVVASPAARVAPAARAVVSVAGRTAALDTPAPAYLAAAAITTPPIPMTAAATNSRAQPVTHTTSVAATSVSTGLAGPVSRLDVVAAPAEDLLVGALPPSARLARQRAM